MLTIPCVAYVSENVKPRPLMRTPSGISPWATRIPPQLYSASKDAWIAPLLVASNSALADANSRPELYDERTWSWKRSRSRDSPANDL